MRRTEPVSQSVKFVSQGKPQVVPPPVSQPLNLQRQVSGPSPIIRLESRVSNPPAPAYVPAPAPAYVPVLTNPPQVVDSISYSRPDNTSNIM